MSADHSPIRSIIQNAREALRRGDLTEARRWAEQASRLAPDLEDAWLLMAAVSSPRASLSYAKRALALNPQSQRARRAVEWARSRPGAEEPVERNASPSRAKQPSPAPRPPQSPKRRGLLYAALLIGLGCLVIGFAAWATVRPAVASILSSNPASLPTATAQEPQFAQAADLPKPTSTPEWTTTPTVTATLPYTPTPSLTPTPEFTSTPLPTETPPPTDTPGVIEAAIIPDTPTPLAAPTQANAASTQPAVFPSSGNGDRWIDVNLSTQRLYAYEGDVMVNAFVVSTGVWSTPTVTGKYKIYVKYLSTTMTGPGYYLPNVPYTMYFYKGYGIHGTYWHNNFGTPMSHGCVNLSIPDAEWLYYWASVGTVVNIHY